MKKFYSFLLLAVIGLFGAQTAQAGIAAGTTIYYDFTALTARTGVNYFEADGTWTYNTTHSGEFFSVTYTNDLDITESWNLYKTEVDGWQDHHYTAPAEGQNMVVVAADGSYTWGTHVLASYTITKVPHVGIEILGPTDANANDPIEITLSPLSGFSPAFISIVDANEQDVPGIIANGYTYSFAMPASNVTVTATASLNTAFLAGNSTAFGGTTAWAADQVSMPRTSEEYAIFALTCNLPAATGDDVHCFKITSGVWDCSWGYNNVNLTKHGNYISLLGTDNDGNIRFQLSQADQVTITFTYEQTGVCGVNIAGTVITHGVTYDGNGATSGDVPVDENRYEIGAVATVIGAGELEKEGARFKCWNTQADGSGTPYNMGGLITMNEDVTLYAQWTTGVQYELDGGVMNPYADAQAMYADLNADYNAFTNTSVIWAPLAECTDDAMNQGIPAATYTQNPQWDLTFFPGNTKWGWLLDYMDAQCADQGKTLPSAGGMAYIRFNLQAFFRDAQRTSWPASANYATCGVSSSEYESFMFPQFPEAEIALLAPVKEGFAFEGWFDNAEFTGTPVTVIDENSELTLYAKWRALPAVYFVNNLGWDAVYVNLYNDSYWNETLGSGNNGGSAVIINQPMKKMGITNFWRYYYDGTGYTHISFTSASQDHYEHFWEIDGAIYRGDFVAGGEENMFVSTTDVIGQYNGVNYYSDGLWLPFGIESLTLNYEDLNYKTICLPHTAILDGATAYEVNNIVGSNIILQEHMGRLQGGVPYVIKPTQATVTAAIYGEPVAKPINNFLIGNLAPESIVLTAADDAYILSGNEFHHIEGTATSEIAQFKAYLKVPVVEAPVLRIIEAENGATNIFDVQDNTQAQKFIMNGQVLILREGVLYDVTGRAVRQ